MSTVSAGQSIGMKSQKGIVLIVGLVMVLLISIVAMAAIRGTGLQETMAGNMRDRNLAFQAAEVGLREGEAILNLPVLPPFDGSAKGYYQDIDGSSATGYWDSVNWEANSVEVGLDMEQVAANPRFVIEEVSYTVTAGSDGGAIDFESTLKAEDATLYRITSLGYGGTTNSTVILQSSFKR